MVHASMIIIENYRKFSDMVLNVMPDINDANYIKSFKANMNVLSNELKKEIVRLKAEAKDGILKNRIMSPYNTYFLNVGDLEKVRYVPARNGTLMDRRG